MSKNPSFFEYIQTALKLAKEYFIDSEEKYKALALLALSVICMIGLVITTAYFSWWWVMFWSAFETKNIGLFLASMKIFCYISSVFITLKASYSYLTNLIKLNWREWLTQKLIKEYLENQTNFLDLSRFSEELQNPAQRIQQDVDYFVSLSVNLSLDFLRSMLTQVTFISALWIIGGALTIRAFGLQLIIPGYLVWVAIGLSVVATLIKHRIGQPLQELNNQEANVEADFRSELEQIPQDAESIALERGQTYYQSSLSEKFTAIYQNTYEKIKINTMLSAFDTLYNQFSWVLPYLAASPIYFSNVITLGQLMQVGFSFGEVNTSFSWFMNCFSDLAWFKTNIKRIVELRETLNQGLLETTPKNIKISYQNTHSIIIHKLSIQKPKSSQIIFEQMNLELKQGESVTIFGPSGLGKSTLFKSIGGTWLHGGGEIILPLSDSIYFLSQKPAIPHATLRQILSYPLAPQTYSQDNYLDALHKVGLKGDFQEQLDIKQNWGKKLSGGQQQKIAFVRVLLLKPKWLFLDESTASLDVESENTIYDLLKNELPDTTFISIAHRESVKKYHQKCISFFATDLGRLNLESSLKHTS